MLRKCLSCGKTFEGRTDATLCPDCAKKSQRSTNLRPRTCRTCGKTFEGGPRAWYCPECRRERIRARDREIHAHGPARPLGSTDKCIVCGREYIVTGGMQKYCPDCAEAAVRAIDRAQSIAWNDRHVDMDDKREKRHEAAAEIPCAVCGRLFVPRQGGTLTCSDGCRAEYRRRAQHEYDMTHKAAINERKKARLHEKLAAMSPEELAEYRRKANERAAANYARRKNRGT